MTNKFETTELDKLEDMLMPSRDPNLGDKVQQLVDANRSRITGITDAIRGLPSQQPLWEQHWPSFAVALCEKLAKGHHEYGDESFGREPADLWKELQAEALDLAGWGFVLWVRLEKLKYKVGA